MFAALISLALAANGPFDSSWDSLKSYRAPEWYRDAKFGIWSHWGPQAVPMEGDWYARQMYIEGSRQYQHHLQTYGHPSKSGYKEIIPLWKAEKWDPNALMRLYKQAGARYFVSMGVHHDNFDLWDSKFNPWNATKMGPKRDVVGEWQRAAKREGLKFGVSEHLGASYTWFQPSKGADASGPYAGVKYDGADPKYESLYHTTARPDDKGWYTTDPEWRRIWSQRIHDLVGRYRPDLLYSDGGIPFGAVGRQMVADFYNQGWKAGRTDKVYLAKDGGAEFVLGSCVLDRERGAMASVQELPWQTDTSIGDWFYNRNWPYRSPDWVIDTLVDVVSKNGNMLLNVVQRPDGSLDDEVVRLLHSVGDWMGTNGEAIYGTRPWLTYGEGPTKVAGGHFKEDFPFGSKDIRFTRKGNHTLYAIFLGWPETSTVIRSLAKLPSVAGKIESVSLLGSKERIAWRHSASGLEVNMPSQKTGDYAHVLKIVVDDLNAFRPDLAPRVPREAIVCDVSGSFTLVESAAETEGDVKVENQGGPPNFGYWDHGKDFVSWVIQCDRKTHFDATLEAATVFPRTALALEIRPDVPGNVPGSQPIRRLVGQIESTGDWGVFRKMNLGFVELPPGRYEIRLVPSDEATWKAANVRNVRLIGRP